MDARKRAYDSSRLRLPIADAMAVGSLEEAIAVWLRASKQAAAIFNENFT